MLEGFHETLHERFGIRHVAIEIAPIDFEEQKLIRWWPAFRETLLPSGMSKTWS